MANPVVETTNTSEETTGTTSHTVDLPASIADGDLLMMFFSMQEVGGIEVPDGWIGLGAGYELAAEVAESYIMYRYADGTEGSTVTVTSRASWKSAHVTYRISGWAGVPEVSEYVTGNSGSANSPSLTPIGGSQDFLFISTYTSRGGTGPSSYPTGYTGDNLNANGSSVNVAVGTKDVTSASDDPASFSNSSNYWIAMTVAIPSVDNASSIPYVANQSQSAVGSGDVTIDKPEGTVEGDTMIALIMADNAVTTVPSGWTEEVNESNESATDMYMYSKVAGASEGSSYTFSISGGSERLGMILRVVDGPTSSPVDQKGSNYSNSNVTSGTMGTKTPTAGNNLWIIISGAVGPKAKFFNWAMATDDPNFSVQTNFRYNSSPDVTLNVMTARRPSSSATGSVSFGQNPQDHYVIGMLNIGPGSIAHTKTVTATAEANPSMDNPTSLLRAITVTAEAGASFVKSVAKDMIVTAQAGASFIRSLARDLIVTAQATPIMNSGLLFVKSLVVTAQAGASFVMAQVTLVALTVTAEASASFNKLQSFLKTFITTAQVNSSVSTLLTLSKVLTATAQATASAVVSGLSLSREMLVTASATVSVSMQKTLSKTITAIGRAVVNIAKDYGYVDKYPENDANYTDKYPEN